MGQSDVTKEELLRGLYAAVALFGVSGASMTKISKETGYSRALLHYHFKSKAQMMSALLADIEQDYIGGLCGYLDEKGWRIKNLASYHFLGSEKYSIDRFSVWISFHGELNRSSVYTAGIGRVHSRLFEICKSVAEAADCVDPAKAAMKLIIVIEGALSCWRSEFLLSGCENGNSTEIELRTTELMKSILLQDN